jgi:hypothetical protein
MEENIRDSSFNEEKEPLNTPSTDAPTQAATETSEIINPTSEIKEMEVHHHTHDPAAPHHKKNWKAYFWEFLMLFLAVFCGFLAEYQLEHKIEKDRTREYASLLIKDLENDTINITRSTKELEKVLKSFDSISSFVFRGVSGNKVPGSFYYHSQIGTISPAVIWNDASLIQLTQSGNLRYFRNHELVNKISSYYSNQYYVRNLNNGDKERREKILAIRSRILNNHFYKYYSKVLTIDTLQLADSLMTNMIPIQNSDIDLLNEYANSFENRRGFINLLLTNTYPGAISSATELISLLKTEYGLK